MPADRGPVVVETEVAASQFCYFAHQLSHIPKSIETCACELQSAGHRGGQIDPVSQCYLRSDTNALSHRIGNFIALHEREHRLEALCTQVSCRQSCQNAIHIRRELENVIVLFTPNKMEMVITMRAQCAI